ncbi:translation initiation factor IF-2-like isoform X2 [Cervus elaphus]|uniref:translation initiation factor IF-2-like isoform X2 n=1 Tax=Cervus elaphus TaxID=9860 RepID=UPI001CC2DEF6|nr:translation initiation factor IF-2-like isoform X2 [Cervus elaphus]
MRSEKGSGLREGEGAELEGSGRAVLRGAGEEGPWCEGRMPGIWEEGARELRGASSIGEGPSRRGAGPWGREEGVGERPGPKCSGRGPRAQRVPGRAGSPGEASRTGGLGGGGGEPTGSREREEPYRKKRVPDSGGQGAEGRGGGAGVSRRPGRRLPPSSRARTDVEMLQPDRSSPQWLGIPHWITEFSTDFWLSWHL